MLFNIEKLMDCCMQDLSDNGSKQGSSLAAQADLDVAYVADSQGTDEEVSTMHAEECNNLMHNPCVSQTLGICCRLHSLQLQAAAAAFVSAMLRSIGTT